MDAGNRFGALTIVSCGSIVFLMLLALSPDPIALDCNRLETGRNGEAEDLHQELLATFDGSSTSLQARDRSTYYIIDLSEMRHAGGEHGIGCILPKTIRLTTTIR